MHQSAAILLFAGVVAVGAAPQIDYAKLWEAGAPFDRFLSSVRVREAQWKSRFANAAIDPDSISRVRALNARRRILAIAEDRCSDSAWALPYVAKLAAVVPERLELRVIDPQRGADVLAANATPDGRRATPTLVILDEANRPLGAWIERPAALQSWVIGNRSPRTSSELHAEIDKWYVDDAGRSTVREIVALLEKSFTGGD